MYKKNKKGKNSNHSAISQYHRRGTILTPPLGSLPQLKMASWRNDRLPEMLWATLIVGQLKQTEALAIFRPVAKFFHQFNEEKDACMRRQIRRYSIRSSVISESINGENKMAAR